MLSDYYLDKTTILGRRYPQFPARLPYLPAGYHACAAPPHACCERSQRYSEECAPDAPRTARRHQRCHLLCLSLSLPPSHEPLDRGHPRGNCEFTQLRARACPKTQRPCAPEGQDSCQPGLEDDDDDDDEEEEEEKEEEEEVPA
jgi:hypothetical protein